MCSISVVMPVYNAMQYLKEAIDSVLIQSFADFEFIIVDDGSTDETISIINSYNDKRIRLLKNKHSFIESLNLGMRQAKGKYIARMDADDIMHIDRLKVQYAIMEEEPDITVCGSDMKLFGTQTAIPSPMRMTGYVQNPLLQAMNGNFIAHPTVMLRTDFLHKHNLSYENYAYAEDYKLWVEIAKRGGVFYIESQLLLNYRISDGQVSIVKNKEQQQTAEKIKLETINYLLEMNKEDYPEIGSFYNSMKKLRKKDLISKQDQIQMMYNVFFNNINSLKITEIQSIY